MLRFCLFLLTLLVGVAFSSPCDAGYGEEHKQPHQHHHKHHHHSHYSDPSVSVSSNKHHSVLEIKTHSAAPRVTETHHKASTIIHHAPSSTFSVSVKPSHKPSHTHEQSKSKTVTKVKSSSKTAVATKSTKPATKTSRLPTAPTSHSINGAYPFSQLVAFGDELSDNGNGSYAHGITGDPANVYGFGTWTNGPVAVSYLADLLGVPLVDKAWGGDNGGENFGATVDNDYTPAGATWNGLPVPSVKQQIYDNYTADGLPGIESSLQFIMVGENDLSKHTDAFYEGDAQNADFEDTISSTILSYAEYLIEKGAPYVVVGNIYPKHKAPVTVTYLCSDGGCVDTWGEIIESANDAIEKKLAASEHHDKLIYYDIYGFMMNVMDNKDTYGLTEDLAAFCDGDPAVAQWDKCIAGDYVWEGAEKFFWMNYIQPTTHVHRLIAQDMKQTIDAFLG